MFDTNWRARALLVPAALLALSVPLAAQGPTGGSGIPIRKDAARPVPARDTTRVVTDTSTGAVAATRADTTGADTTGAMTSMAGSGADFASWSDANILAHLRTGDSLEVQTAQMALQQSQNPQVQSLARTLIDDHTKNMRAADSLAQALGIALQAAPSDSSAQHMMHEMSSWQGQSGVSFDRAWTQFQLNHHQMDVQKLPKLRQQAQNPAVQSFIDQTLPVIRMHLDRAQTVQQQVASGT